VVDTDDVDPVKTSVVVVFEGCPIVE